MTLKQPLAAERPRLSPVETFAFSMLIASPYFALLGGGGGTSFCFCGTIKAADSDIHDQFQPQSDI